MSYAQGGRVAPSRVRGLKQRILWLSGLKEGRTLTGAWIETFSIVPAKSGNLGRTLTGAWIETIRTLLRTPIFTVAPSRVRGLKLLKKEDY